MKFTTEDVGRSVVVTTNVGKFSGVISEVTKLWVYVSYEDKNQQLVRACTQEEIEFSD